MSSGLEFLLIAAGIVGGLCLLIFSFFYEQKRQASLQRMAQLLRFDFEKAPNYELSRQFHFLEKMNRGSNRYAFCVLRGEYQSFPILIFDHHYETYTKSRKSGRRTHHHFQHFFVIQLPRAFPELHIFPENLLVKFAQIFGYDDIDFESYEFSKKYLVRSKDKKFAYDFCHSRMMEYLLTQKNLSIEVDQNYLCLIFSGKNKPKRLRFHLHRLIQIRKLMPSYLFSENIS